MTYVLHEITQERSEQDLKWGEQNHPDGTGGNGYVEAAQQWRKINDAAAKGGTLTWHGILSEEYYEALAESDPERLREELIQVAAVTVAWIEALDRRLDSLHHLEPTA